MVEEYHEHECYDCLGVFPGHMLNRKTVKTVIGQSTRQADFRNSEDYFDTSRTTSHYGYSDIFLCGGCRSKRFYKAVFKWVIVPICLVAGAYYWLNQSHSIPRNLSYDSSENDTDQSQVDYVSEDDLLADAGQEDFAETNLNSDPITNESIAPDEIPEIASSSPTTDVNTTGPNTGEADTLDDALSQPRDIGSATISLAKDVAVRGDPAGWFTDDHYPSRALRKREEGSISYTLNVGPNGRVAACSIVVSSGSNSLDKETCKGLQRRARFSPAVNDDGLPIQSTFDGTVSWVLPD